LSEDLIKTIQNLIDSKKGDKKRLDDILNTIKQGTPLYLSDYKYLENLNSENEIQNENVPDVPQVTPLVDTDAFSSEDNLKDNDAMTILKTRLANGEISVEEFRTIKKALQDSR
jgi:hypothetical protein